MKKLLILLIISSLISCTTTIKSPVTQIEYTGYIKEEGVGVTLKPPFWGWCVSLYRYITE